MKTLVVKIDAASKSLIGALAPSKSPSSAYFFNINLPIDAFKNGINFDLVFGDAFKEFLQTNAVLPANIVVLLPNEDVSIDIIKLPTYNKSKMVASVNMEFETLYKNSLDLDVLCTTLSSDKLSTYFMYLMCKKYITQGIKKALFPYKFNLVSITQEANALNNALYALNPASKKHSYLGVFVDDAHTCICFNKNETTVGGLSLPFGQNILSETVLFDRKKLPLCGCKEAIEIDKCALNPTDKNMDSEQILFHNMESLMTAVSIYSLGKTEKDSFDYMQISLGGNFSKLEDKFADIKLRFLTSENPSQRQILNNLSLYGGFFTSQFNKELVF